MLHTTHMKCMQPGVPTARVPLYQLIIILFFMSKFLSLNIGLFLHTRSDAIPIIFTCQII